MRNVTVARFLQNSYNSKSCFNHFKSIVKCVTNGLTINDFDSIETMKTKKDGYINVLIAEFEKANWQN